LDDDASDRIESLNILIGPLPRLFFIVAKSTSLISLAHAEAKTHFPNFLMTTPSVDHCYRPTWWAIARIVPEADVDRARLGS
jgi:hypothetical protein